jgi:nicotinamide mononucleotide (NMN) deamidase PncC
MTPNHERQAQLGCELSDMLAVTGAAGPAPQDGAAPGRVITGVLVEGSVSARTHHFDGDPEEVCERACNAALEDVLAAVRARAMPSRLQSSGG